MEQQKLPNATAVLVLGILSIVTCCLYGGGLILAIVALVLSKKDMALYRLDPAGYSNYSSLNTGKILAIIGIVLSIITLITIAVSSYLGEDYIKAWAEEMQLQAAQGQ